MWCAFFSRQSRYSNATHALMNARQSFWIMRVHQSPAFSIFLNIFPCVTLIVTHIRWSPRCDRPFSNIAIWPWLRYLFYKNIIFRINQTRLLALGNEGNPNWYNLYTSGLKYDRLTTFIAMPIDVVKLTLSLRPSDMKKGQSMVKYTFLFNISVINLTFLGYIIIL